MLFSCWFSRSHPWLFIKFTLHWQSRKAASFWSHNLQIPTTDNPLFSAGSARNFSAKYSFFFWWLLIDRKEHTRPPLWHSFSHRCWSYVLKGGWTTFHGEAREFWFFFKANKCKFEIQKSTCYVTCVPNRLFQWKCSEKHVVLMICLCPAAACLAAIFNVGTGVKPGFERSWHLEVWCCAQQPPCVYPLTIRLCASSENWLLWGWTSGSAVGLFCSN